MITKKYFWLKFCVYHISYLHILQSSLFFITLTIIVIKTFSLVTSDSSNIVPSLSAGYCYLLSEIYCLQVLICCWSKSVLRTYLKSRCGCEVKPCKSLYVHLRSILSIHHIYWCMQLQVTVNVNLFGSSSNIVHNQYVCDSNLNIVTTLVTLIQWTLGCTTSLFGIINIQFGKNRHFFY